jgi:MULE transposase domain/MuDR family transposase
MAIPLQIGDTFPDILAAKNAIHSFMASNAESFKTAHSDKTRVILLCKLDGCLFRIRAFDTKKRGVTITHLVPHSCSPATHYTSSAANALSYLLPHHRATVIDNPRITPKQIQSNERLQFSNKIPYQQAYRAKQAIRDEIWGNESDCFALFPDYIARFQAADPQNFAAIQVQNGIFEAAFFAPAGLRKAGKHLRPFTAIDGTHTKSQYRMMLLVACGIDANDHVVPLAWALVPIENHEWWTWFLNYLAYTFPSFRTLNHIFISDREKG